MTKPIKLTERNAAIIARYKEAFRRANGREIQVTYKDKWFELRTDNGPLNPSYPTSYRYKELVDMCEVLEKKAEERKPHDQRKY